jgi:hypothetical protein
MLKVEIPAKRLIAKEAQISGGERNHVHVHFAEYPDA